MVVEDGFSSALVVAAGSSVGLGATTRYVVGSPLLMVPTTRPSEAMLRKDDDDDDELSDEAEAVAEAAEVLSSAA